MDTNQLNQIVNEISRQGGQSNTIALMLAVFTSCGGLITAIALWIKAKAAHLASEDAKAIAFKTSGDAKAAALETTASVNRIEVSVNHERSAMIEKLTSLTTEVEQLKADKMSMLAQLKKMGEEIEHLKSLAPTAKNSISKD